MRKLNYEAEPAQIMRSVVMDYGKQIFLTFNKKKLSGIITELYSRYPVIRDALHKAVEFGIPAELLKLYAKGDRDNQIRIIARRFAVSYKLTPESSEVVDSISCLTFALDYGMFDYSVYRPPSPRVIPASEAGKRRYPELKEAAEDRTETETETGAEEETDGDGVSFVDFKTWFEKKRVITKDEFKDRNGGGVYLKGGDDNYYELSQSDYLVESGADFGELFKNFSSGKREREIIKMGIDICSQPGIFEISAEPSNIYRDKYGNYGLKSVKPGGAGEVGNPVFLLGVFMRGLLGREIKPESREDGPAGEILNGVLRKTQENNNNKYTPEMMREELEIAFELALEEWLFAGTTSVSELTYAKASADKSTGEDTRDMSVPDKYASIGPRAFIRRSNLRSVILPGSIETVGGFAFGWCGNLENVTMEGGGENKKLNIGSFAFWGCENLKKVTMRETIAENIGDCAFYGCRKLKVDIYGDIKGGADELVHRVFYGARDSEINIYTDGRRKEKKYDRIFNNRIQFY